jgi:hypothetical protein
MKRQPKSNKDRNRAKYLRQQAKHRKLKPAELAWLGRYEGDTARWLEGPPARLEERERGGVGAAPVHSAEPVGAGGPERFAALPVLPPAAPSGQDQGPSGSQPGPAGVPGSHDPGAPAGGPAGASEPLLDAPPAPAADPEVLEGGARRFAAAVVALNTFGLGALLELFPEGSLPLPADVESLVRSRQAHAAVLAGIHAAALELAHQHPILCAIGPSPAAIVLGASSVSLTALYFRHFRPRDPAAIDAATSVEVGPAPAPSSNGVRPKPEQPAPQPDGTLDFYRVFDPS